MDDFIFGMGMEQIHMIVGSASSFICLVLGIVLLMVRFNKNLGRKGLSRPTRYIAARIALGWAYVIIGIFSAVLLFTVDVSEQEKVDFFPLAGLIISISQISLFTVAVLAVFNSKLLNRQVISINLLPIFVLMILYFVLSGQEAHQLHVRQMLFVFYMLQLVVYTMAFIIERRKYLLIVEDYFDLGKLYDKYSCKGVTVLYFAAIVVGIWALVSYFFTSLEQETLFIFCYTIYYVVVAWYYLDYSKISRRIHDITTPENWSETEEISRTAHEKEKKKIISR